MNTRVPDERNSYPVPEAVLVSRLLWILAGVLFFGFAAFIGYESWRDADLGLGQIALMVLLAAAGTMVCVLAARLFKGQRKARAQLSWLGLIAALPMAVKMGRFSLLAAVVLLAVVLLWLPASVRYFRAVSPKPRKNPAGPPAPPRR